MVSGEKGLTSLETECLPDPGLRSTHRAKQHSKLFEAIY
jgi:hypothetical protein